MTCTCGTEFTVIVGRGSCANFCARCDGNADDMWASHHFDMTWALRVRAIYDERVAQPVHMEPFPW